VEKPVKVIHTDPLTGKRIPGIGIVHSRGVRQMPNALSVEEALTKIKELIAEVPEGDRQELYEELSVTAAAHIPDDDDDELFDDDSVDLVGDELDDDEDE
jgi:hypothetical protein